MGTSDRAEQTRAYSQSSNLQVDIQGKVYQRTREHLRPRSKDEAMPLPSGDPTPVPTEAPTHKRIDAPEAKFASTAPPIGESTNLNGNSLTLDQPPSEQLPYSPMWPSSETCEHCCHSRKTLLSAKEPSYEVRACYPNPSQVQRLGGAQEK